MRRWALVVFLLAFRVVPARADDQKDAPPTGRHYPLNLALYYPLSLNRTVHDRANLSLSVLYGRLGSVDGLDLSLGASALSDDLTGAQLCGLLGVVGERGAGVQAAGLASISGDSFTGLQMAGLASITGESHSGVQAAGLLSIAGENLEGVQAAALMAIAGEHADGLQVAGLASIAGDDASVTQFALGFNVIGDAGRGLQMSGVFNVAGDDFEGVQAAGLFNVTGGTLTGAQVGAANLTGRSEGLQIGLFNGCGECSGLQLGLVNRARGRNDGVAVGLVNLAENGHVHGVVWAGSTAGLSGGVKFALGRTYSLVSLGLFALEGENGTAPTLGFHYGVTFPVGRRSLSADVGYRYRDNGDLFSNSGDQPDQHVFEARVGLTLRLSERLDLLLGAGAAQIFDRGRSFGSGETRPLALVGIEFR